MPDVPSVPVAELPVDFSTETNRILLDVREDDEWANGHVAGALHIPLGDVPARIDEIDLDAELFVICHSGGRSARVLGYLAQRGYEGVNVSGGVVAWAQAGRPLETGAGGSRGSGDPAPGTSQ
jgi:rhodanese-related sulfurtransferase